LLKGHFGRGGRNRDIRHNQKFEEDFVAVQSQIVDEDENWD
jgi:hypothetical protein